MTTRAATLRRGPAPRAPRRVSGPARPAARPAPPRRQSTDSFAALGRLALRVPDARVLDRLIRGRVWIGIVAGALVGIVAMQVSLLKLNTGISRDMLTAQTLERQNAEMRASVSRLGSGQRIQDVAAEHGMVMPDAGQLTYLRAGRPGDAQRGARIMTPPDPAAAQQRAQALLAQQQLEQQQAAEAQPAATDPATSTTTTTTTTTPAGTTATAPPATTTSAPAATAPPTTTTQPVTQAQAAPAPSGGEAAPAGQQ